MRNRLYAFDIYQRLYDIIFALLGRIEHFREQNTQLILTSAGAFNIMWCT